MENSNQYTAEQLQKCPFHHTQNTADSNNSPGEHANTGDWGDLDEDDEAGTDPDRHQQHGNDNSGGAASTGSAAANS